MRFVKTVSTQAAKIVMLSGIWGQIYSFCIRYMYVSTSEYSGPIFVMLAQSKRCNSTTDLTVKFVHHRIGYKSDPNKNTALAACVTLTFAFDE